MGKLRLKSKKEFERLHAAGMKAMAGNRYEAALKHFTEADTLARQCNDRRKRLDTLNPIARVLWSMEEFDKAAQKLSLAKKIATDLALRDEQAIVLSNKGRFEAVKIIKRSPSSKHAGLLHKKALPHFIKAQKMLDGHDHLYYRYANAKHGALVAALAQDYRKASPLVAEGSSVAFKKIRVYDTETPYKINPSGLEYFAAAAQLIHLGMQNPNSREYKNQEKTTKELIK